MESNNRLFSGAAERLTSSGLFCNSSHYAAVSRASSERKNHKPYIIIVKLKRFKCRDCKELNVDQPAAAWKGVGLICWKCHNRRISSGVPSRTQWKPKSIDLLPVRRRVKA